MLHPQKPPENERCPVRVQPKLCCMKLLLTHAVLNSTIHSTHLHGTFSPRALKQGSIYLSKKKSHNTKMLHVFLVHSYTVTGWGCDLSSDTEDNWSCTGLVRCMH